MLSFFFNDTATTEIYTLSLHDALPIYLTDVEVTLQELAEIMAEELELPRIQPKGTEKIVAWKDKYSGIRTTGPESLRDRKSTRLNSSHANISYAVFCLKKQQILTSPPL